MPQSRPRKVERSEPVERCGHIDQPLLLLTLLLLCMGLICLGVLVLHVPLFTLLGLLAILPLAVNFGQIISPYSVPTPLMKYAYVFVYLAVLMLCDLAARVMLSPRELPIGVVTSFIGSILFIVIFYKTRRCMK